MTAGHATDGGRTQAPACPGARVGTSGSGLPQTSLHRSASVAACHSTKKTLWVMSLSISSICQNRVPSIRLPLRLVGRNAFYSCFPHSGYSGFLAQNPRPSNPVSFEFIIARFEFNPVPIFKFSVASHSALDCLFPTPGFSRLWARFQKKAVQSDGLRPFSKLPLFKINTFSFQSVPVKISLPLSCSCVGIKPTPSFCQKHSHSRQFPVRRMSLQIEVQLTKIVASSTQCKRCCPSIHPVIYSVSAC